MKGPIVIMDFDHIYKEETFYKGEHLKWIDCSQIEGTNCYCDEVAATCLKEKIADCTPYGIHFIDSGNFHYMTKLWLDRIQEPLTLVVFDHHPDMQPSLFENLMSCGCWVKQALDENPMIQKVILVGIKDSLIKQIPPSYQDKIVIYSEQALTHEETWKQFAALHITYPLYISIDKDVLDVRSASTNWDQGSLSLEALQKLLRIMIKHHPVLGIDICGESEMTLPFTTNYQQVMINDQANATLLDLFKKYVLEETY